MMAFIRHSSPGKDAPEYPGLSKAGVEKAKTEKATDLLNFLEQCEPGTVLFIGMASENPRTKSTAMAIGEGIAQKIDAEKREDLMIINWEDVAKIKEENQPARIAGKIAEIINANPGKKIIVNTPMVSEHYLSYGQWSDEYYDKLIKATNSRNKYDYAKLWMKTGGAPIEGVRGPDPTEVAKQQLRGVRALEKIAKHYGIENRPVVGMEADHSWHMGALAVYLTNGGKIDSAGVRTFANEEIREGEIMHVKVENGKGSLVYNGKEYPIDPKLLEDVEKK